MLYQNVHVMGQVTWQRALRPGPADRTLYMLVFRRTRCQISNSLNIAPPCKQRKYIQPRDLQHFGYQYSSMRIRPGSPVEVATERCLAECSQFGDQSPGPAVVAAGS